MANVTDMKTRSPWRVDQHNDASKPAPVFIPIVTHDEHACTRQARILHAWLLDSADDSDVGIEWTIARLKQALEWAEVRKIFRK